MRGGGTTRARRWSAPDRGITYVELLVAIVLVGTAVVATLVAVRATTQASLIDVERGRARAWLLEAADRIDQATLVPCDGSNTTTIVDDYRDAADDAPRPAAWTSGTIDVSVQFIFRSNPDADYSFSPNCFAPLVGPDHPHSAQLVTIEVMLPSGDVEALEVVKHE